MKVENESSNKVFSKKLLLQIYFVFFILLNILDFLNYLSGDIDFFKKILSWVLIGYVFYKASFSKIFVGYRNKLIDLFFILGFSLMGIMKSLFQYTKINQIGMDNFPVFYYILSLIPKSSKPFLDNSFMIGLIIIIVSSIYLLKKYKPSKKSLVGSFNLKGYLKFIGGNYFILISTAIFFGLIVFNFIMEWFALAVDSIILVLGLIYYLVYYLHNHTKLNTGKYLNKVSNTGNTFYQNLIGQFSNKGTFLIGVSFILTLHLLVDAGVYLVPFSTGLTNTLYGSAVDTTPIVNLIDFSNSRLISDILIVKGNKIIPSLSFIFVHLSSLILMFILMITPFYYFFLNIKKEKIKLPNWVEFLFVVTLIITCVTFAFPDLDNPITISVPEKGEGFYGVDLDTNQVIDSNNGDQFKITFEVIMILIISLVTIIETKVLLKSNANKAVKKKVLPVIVLLFFIMYISIFFFTTVRNEINENLFTEQIEESTSLEFERVNDIYLNNLENEKIRNAKPIDARTDFFQVSFIPFSEFDDNLNLSGAHQDYLLVKVSNVTKEHFFTVTNYENKALFSQDSGKISELFMQDEFVFISKVGENNFKYSLGSSGKLSLKSMDVELENIIDIVERTKTTIFIEYLRIIVTSIFYIFGLMAFVKFFVKENFNFKKV